MSTEGRALFESPTMGQCELDGVITPCSMAARVHSAGAAIQCPFGYCGPEVAVNGRGERRLTTGFRAYADGTSGHLVPDTSGGVYLIDENGNRQGDSGVTGWKLVGSSTENQTKCDLRLAGIFGGPNTVMATKWDLEGLRPAIGQLPERRVPAFDREVGEKPIPGSEDPRAGTVHLYSNADGTQVNTPNAYTPPGWAKVVPGPGATGNFLRFYYAPGSLKKYGYDEGLTVNFTHIGPTNADGIPLVPSRNGPTNQMNSVQVGVLGGGPGTNPNLTKGSANGYWVHSHMIFNKWNGKSGKESSPIDDYTRVDPRAIFCSDLGFKEWKIEGRRPR